VKAEFASPSASLEIVTQEIASWVLPRGRIEIRDVTLQWNIIQGQISQRLKAADAARVTSAFQGVLQRTPKGHINIQQLAQGETTDKIVKEQGSGVTSRMTGILGDENYLKDLGRLVALDMYLVQTDRVLSANFGNWMSQTSPGANQPFDGQVSGLIDNVDRYGNVLYFIKASQEDPLVSTSGGKLTLQTPANPPDAIVNYVIDTFLERLTREKVFDTPAASKAYSLRQYRDRQGLTNRDFWFTNMKAGYQEGVQTLKNVIQGQQWQEKLRQQMKDYGVSDEAERARIMNQLRARNHAFLGL
jgi:hypothetical protein